MKGRSYSRGSGDAGDAWARARGGLAALPLWAQVLVASRMVRRASLAILEDVPAAPGDAVGSICDAVASCARRGGVTQAEADHLERSLALLDRRLAPGTGELRRALRFATDAARAAAVDSADAAVTDATMNAVRALEEDERVTSLQLRILLAGDVELLGFACAEAGVGRHDALSDAVVQRLAPTHAIMLSEPRRSAEDDFR